MNYGMLKEKNLLKELLQLGWISRVNLLLKTGKKKKGKKGGKKGGKKKWLF